MAFFYDNCDYLIGGVIGSGTTEVDCTVWEDFLKITSNATRDAFIKAFIQYVYSATPCTSGETCNDVYDEKIYTDFWQGCYIEYATKYSIFWNMMMCEENKKIGVITETYGVPTIDGSTLDIDVDVDYGDGTFDLTIAEEYQDMSAQFMCCVQNVMVLIMGEEFEQSNMTEFDYIEPIPPA